MDQEQLKQALQESRQELMSLIEDLPEGAFLEPGVMDDWTLKDILAHLNRWEGMCITLLWKLAQGKPDERLNIQSQEEVDRYNAQWYQEDRDRPLDLIMADFKGLRSQTLRRIEEFNHEQLTHPEAFEELRGDPLWKWVAVDTFEHEMEHLPAIREWLTDRR